METIQMDKFPNCPVAREVRDSPDTKQRDEANLARLGKRGILKNLPTGIGEVYDNPILDFEKQQDIYQKSTQSCDGRSITNVYEYGSGGPAGAVYGFIFVWAGLAATFAMLSELVSMAPTAGGQYHWCSMLASHKAMKFSSYITGWLTVVGWQATFATACFLVSTIIQGLIILTQPSYVPLAWHTTLLYWAVLFFCLAINVIGGSLLPKFEGLILVLHIIGFFAILIPLTYLSDHATAKEVFATWTNEGGWETQGISFFVGLIGAVFAFAGGDAAVHMAEETHDAQRVVPLSLMFSITVNGALGFAMLIAALFCMGNLQSDIDTPTGYPFIEIFLQATGSVAGTAAMASLVVVMAVCATVGMLATASRQFWAFSRDRGIPGWRFWSRVSKRSNIPLNAVLVTATVGTLLGLIPLGSSTAFNDLTSMSTSGLYLSYIICCILLLYRRCTGAILEMVDDRDRNISDISEDDEQIMNTAGAKLVWGPFHLKGIFGIVVNLFAIIYMLITTFFSFWPPTAQVTVSTMNYSAVGTVGVMFLSVVYYFVRANKVYEGPIIEI